MSVDRERLDHSTLREHTDEAFEVKEPIQNPRIAPRVIPVIVTVLIGLVILAILFWRPF